MTKPRVCSLALILVIFVSFWFAFESPTAATEGVAQVTSTSTTAPVVIVTTTATVTTTTTSTATSTTSRTITTPTTVVIASAGTTTTTSTTVTTVTYADLAVNLDKATYSVGETVHISGGFSTPYCTWTYTSGGQGSGLAVDITIYGPGGSLVGGATTNPAAAGYKAYAYDYVLPANAAAGWYKVVVSYHYPCGGFIVYGTNDFLVTCSNCVVLSPSSGSPGTSVVVSGSGWNPSDTSVTLRIMASPNLELLWNPPTSLTCAVSGGVIASGCTFTVKPDALAGGYTIRVTGSQSGSYVDVLFTVTQVTCSTITVPPWGIAVSTDKSVYGPADTVQITGSVSGGPSCACPCYATCTCTFGSNIIVQLEVTNVIGTVVYSKGLTLNSYSSIRPYSDSFSLSSALESGDYQVIARANSGGYPTVEARSSFQLQGTATTIRVTSPATSTFWSLTASGMGGVEGSIRGLDIFGNSAPLPGATVEAKGQQGTFACVGPVCVWDDGTFHLALPPGNYVLTASVNGYVPQSASITIMEGVKSSMDFVLTPATVYSTIVTTLSPATTQTTLTASTTLSTVVTVYTTLGTGGTATAVVQGLVMQVSSNSSVSNLAFDSSRSLLNFTVSGPAGTYGFFDAAIAKSLLLGQPVVLIDGVEHTASVTEDANYWYIHVTYPHSVHQVAIGGSNTIPEFPSSMVFMVTLVLAIVVFKRRTRCITSDWAVS
jgi:hypothetical protein